MSTHSSSWTAAAFVAIAMANACSSPNWSKSPTPTPALPMNQGVGTPSGEAPKPTSLASLPELLETPQAADANAARLTPPQPVRSPVPTLYEAAAECPKYSRPVLGILVGTDGRVLAVRFIKSTGCEQADAKIAEYVRGWAFNSAMRDGREVEAEYIVGISLAG